MSRVASQPSITGRDEVHENQIGRFGARHLDALRTVDRNRDLITATDQATRKHIAIYLVVFDQQQFRHRYPRLPPMASATVFPAD